MNLSRARSSLLCDIFAYGCITTRQHVMYIRNLCMTLTFDLYVGGGGIYSEFYSVFIWFSVCFALLQYSLLFLRIYRGRITHPFGSANAPLTDKWNSLRCCIEIIVLMHEILKALEFGGFLFVLY